MKSRHTLIYVLLSSLLILYVALCSPHWQHAQGADAWEHHRAVVALTRQLWQPGNPTYATPEPSVRYSPYSVALALLSRISGADPYALLCAAAVVNTALFVIGLFALLRAYEQQAAAPTVLLVVVALWGEAPGYANSLALADLPWHQMNPSALAMGLVLLVWTMLRYLGKGQLSPRYWPVLSVLGALALLSHPMTGAFGFGGMLLLALCAPAAERKRMLWAYAAIAALAVALCLTWPWFNFLQAARGSRDLDFWFNPYILQGMLTRWCAPALLLVIVALPYRREELIRFCLLGATACYGLALVSFAVHSPTLARLPMPAMLFLHIPIGIFVHRTGLLRPATWPARLRGIWTSQSAGWPVLEYITAAFLLYCLLPQIWSVFSDPLLARPYLARLLHRPAKIRLLKGEYDRLLQSVGERDVVLGEPLTAWGVPSSNGRIVAALHYELFTPDQKQRHRDVKAFFSEASADDRERIIKDYQVKYIILEPAQFEKSLRDELFEPSAVVRQTESMVLLDVKRWLAARAKRIQEQTPVPVARAGSPN